MERWRIGVLEYCYKRFEHQLFFSNTPLLQYSNTPVEAELLYLNFRLNTGDPCG